MDPRVILQRVARHYREAERYEDRGVHRIEGDKRPLISQFRTEYSRSRGLRFRFGSDAMHLDVLADGDGQLRRARGMEVHGGDLVDVLTMGSAVTFLATAVVPPLFFPDLFAGNTVCDSREPHWRGWEMVDDESCHVLEVQWRGTVFELLVSERRSLIRAFRRRALFPDLPESLLLATYQPTLARVH